MKIVGIIQARLGSSRLPQKVLTPLGNTVLLDYVYERSVNVPSIDQTVIATTHHKQDDLLVRWCAERKMDYFRGSEEDLLDRFLKCADYFQADYIVRITSDCPFICMDMADQLVRYTVEQGSHYGRIEAKHIPIGLKVSIMQVDTLKTLWDKAQHPLYREHITLYLDEHIKDFKVSTLDPFAAYIDKPYRLTIDSKQDLLLCQTIVDHLGSDILVNSKKIIDLLDESPEYAQINSSVSQKKYRVK